MYDNISNRYNNFLESYKKIFELEHQQFLKKNYPNDANLEIKNFAIDALNEEIKKYKKISDECVPVDISKKENDDSMRNRFSSKI